MATDIQGSLISELSTTTIDGTEKIPVEKGLANNHVTTQEIKEFVLGDINSVLDTINGEVI